MATVLDPPIDSPASGPPQAAGAAIPVEPRKDIALLWLELDGRSEALFWVGAGESLYVPFTICGTEQVDWFIRQGLTPGLSPRALTLGVLLDCGYAARTGCEGLPTDAQCRGLIEWAAGTERVAPDKSALDACGYARRWHGAEIGAMVFRRADELFPGNELILTRRIATLWTYADLWRAVDPELYAGILDRIVTLFLGRYVKGAVPPDRERGYAVYAGLAALRLTGKEKEAVSLRHGRIAEARLESAEFALADLAFREDPRKPFGEDAPSVAQLTGAKINPSGQNYHSSVWRGPVLWPVPANDTCAAERMPAGGRYN